MVKVILTKGAEELTRGSDLSTGLDLKTIGYKNVIKNEEGKNSLSEEVILNENDSVILKPMQRILITTGVQVQGEDPYEDEEGNALITDIQIRPRSGLTLKEGILCNIGTIDLDYTGDLGLILMNLSGEEFEIKKDMALGQLVFGFAGIPKIKYVSKFDKKTSRGENGFGSTTK